MTIVYKPLDDVSVRKAIAKSIGSCPLDLDVSSMLARLHDDVELPGREIYMPPVPDGPQTLRISFAPIQSEPAYVFYFDYVPEDD